MSLHELILIFPPGKGRYVWSPCDQAFNSTQSLDATSEKSDLDVSDEKMLETQRMLETRPHDGGKDHSTSPQTVEEKLVHEEGRQNSRDTPKRTRSRIDAANRQSTASERSDRTVKPDTIE